MTPADLKTIREACGLSVPDLAALASVQERTVRYWESGRSAVPDDVAQLVASIDQRIAGIVANALLTWSERQQTQRELPAETVLLRYRESADLWHFHAGWRPLPATAHASMLARVRAALADLHVATRIVYMEPQAYGRWLNGRADSETARAEWAAIQ